MLEAECLAGGCEVLGLVAGAVVGHHPRDCDAQALIIGDGRLEEGNGANGGFVGEDIGKGDAGGIVDADVDVFPADTTRVALAGRR